MHSLLARIRACDVVFDRQSAVIQWVRDVFRSFVFRGDAGFHSFGFDGSQS